MPIILAVLEQAMEQDWVVLLLSLLCLHTAQLSFAALDADFGQNKCNCPSPTDGSFSPTPLYSSPPPSGSGSGTTPPPTPVYSSPPPSGDGNTPNYSSPPPDGSGSSPIYSSPPPIKSTPPLTPPYSAPSSGSGTTPSTPSSPSTGGTTPSVPSYDSPPSPISSSPSYGTPAIPAMSPLSPANPSPSSPSDPVPDVSTPAVPDVSTPSAPDGYIPGIPGSGTGTCEFWGSHLSSIPDILSIFSSISELFGSESSFGSGVTLQQALRNEQKDGYGSLFREGSASLLNSIVNPAFLYSPEQVKKQFNAATVSKTAAAVQGAKFKAANEGRLLP